LARKTDAGRAADWLLYAGADLEAVASLSAHQVAYSVCRSKLAEVLEKTIKANLIHLGWRLQKVHDLQKLCDYLYSYDKDAAESLQTLADELADDYAVGRYPGYDLEDPDWQCLSTLINGVSRYFESIQRLISSADKPENLKKP